ncbi:DUF6795 domain-containing protein [Pseudomonadota bacterium]
MSALIKRLLIVSVLIFPASTQVNAMGIGFKVCLASESSGVVTDNGVPVQGATVTRKVVWENKEYVDEAVTGESGGFAFSSLYERTLLKHAPITPVMGQEVSISYKGEAHLAWRLVKKNWDDLGEVNTGKNIKNNNVKPFAMKCELSNESLSRQVPGTGRGITGRCLLDWEDAPKRKN